MNQNAGYFFENAVLFVQLLRQAGLPVSPEQSMAFAQALTYIDIGQREQVYFAARGLLVTRQENLRLFDTIFNRFWRMPSTGTESRGQRAPIAPRHRPRERKQFNVMSLMADKAREADLEIDVADKSETFSNAEILQRKEFADMTPEELTAVKRLIQEMQWQVSLRRTRRRVIAPRGNFLHLRRAMRSAAKHGGVPLHLSWQAQKIKRRPIILLADVSGSMEKYARLLLQFFFSVSHSLRNVECFVFGTRLTRITSQLKLKNIDRAIEEAALEVMDWSGGTRIGESLNMFNRQWGRRVLRRGAIVILVSDGWERGDTSLLKREMRYLQHRCHRLIWLNPHLGKPNYQPLVEGMAAALPFIDDFMPIHNLQSLNVLSEHLAKLGPYRSNRPII